MTLMILNMLKTKLYSTEHGNRTHSSLFQEFISNKNLNEHQLNLYKDIQSNEGDRNDSHDRDNAWQMRGILRTFCPHIFHFTGIKNVLQF